MIYIISDIHGHYDKYIEALKVINFTSEDTLYILGDILDRGEHGIKILQDIMYKTNIIPILGNHEFMALNVFESLINKNKKSSKLSNDSLENLNIWLEEGGQPTFDSFMELEEHKRFEIIDFIENFEVYREITVNNKTYFLVHAGLNNFDENRDISDYFLHEFIFGRTDYNSIYFKDKILVTGHTPTRLISNEDKIYKNKNHLAIDCACGFGGNLAVYCLDNDKEYYI
ncbi:MAG: metallophosphoesterase [Erysipelotrichaceae bacterium]